MFKSIPQNFKLELRILTTYSRPYRS